jgi:hypothetical protein
MGLEERRRSPGGRELPSRCRRAAHSPEIAYRSTAMTYEKITVARDVVPHIDELPTRQRASFPEIEDPVFWSFYDRCKDYSIVHVTGFYNVFQAMRYLASNRIRGDAVECGCFLGGIAMFIGLLRDELKLHGMEILLFDTFRGAPAGSTDVVFGTPFVEPCELPSYSVVVPQTIARVVGSTDGYRFIEGLVEDTLPATSTGDLALLRLDTDFYSSTAIEFEVLYPRLVSGGILIVDDYGMFQGSRRATDEYLARLDRRPLLNRIDAAVWSGVKP